MPAVRRPRSPAAGATAAPVLATGTAGVLAAAAAPAAAGLPAPVVSRQRRQRVQSAETGMVVLKGLGRLGGRASLTVLAARVGESPAKVHRYLVSLVQEGLVLQDEGSGHYQLGPECLQLGLAAMRQADPIRLAEPALLRLRQALDATCFLAVMGNKGPTIVRFEEPGLPVTLNVRVGSVMSLLWSATGRAFLALLDDARVMTLAREELAGAPAEQRALLAADDPIGTLRREVAASGLATVRDVYLRGISAVAAPLFNHSGQVVAVMTVLGASGGFDPAPGGPVATALQREARAVSAQLGHTCASPG